MRASSSTVIAAILAVALLLITFVVVTGGEPPASGGAVRVTDRRAALRHDADEAARLTADVGAVDDTDTAVRSAAGDASGDPARAIERASAAQLIGVAVDEAGAPLASARLLVTTRRSSIPLGLEASPLDLVEGLTPRADAGQVAGADADEGGVFTVPLPPEAPALAAARELEILVRAPGHVPARPPGERMSSTLPHDIGAIALRPGLTVQGTVRGADGRPIEGARLAFGQADLTGLTARAAPTRGLAFAVTGADGRFTCDELRPGRFWIIAAHAGMAPARVEGSIRPGESIIGFDLTLTRAVPISGTCEGAPAGLQLAVLAAAAGEAGAMEQRWRELLIDPRTGSFGRSAFVDGVTYRLRVAVVDPLTGERDVSRAVEEVEVAAPASDVLLTWKPRTVVVGRAVTRDEKGQLVPLERFMVAHAEGAPEGVDFDARTLEVGDGPKLEHAGGRFRFDDLTMQRRWRGGPREMGDREMSFRVRSVGFEDHFVRGVMVRANQVNDLGDLELARGDVLTVRVKGPGSLPVEGARVYACDAEKDRWFERWRGRNDPAWTSDTVRYGETDAAGVALLPMPAGESALKIGVNADGHVFAEPFESPRSERQVEVELGRGADVIATVTTGAGRPAAGVQVQLLQRNEVARGQRRMDARTDEAGQARFFSVQPGPHALISALPDMEPRRPAHWGDQERVLEVPESGAVEVALTVRATVEVTGRVIEAGAPMPGARVELAVRQDEELLRPNWRSGMLRAVADADGYFTIAGVPVGAFEAGVQHAERAMVTWFEVDVSEDPALLVLALPDATIAGRAVYMGDERPAANVRIRVEDRAGESRAFIGEQTLREEPDGDLERDSDWSQPGRITTPRSGRFRFDGVGTGEALRIQIEGEFVRSRTVDVPALAPGEIRDDLVVRVRRAGSIEVQVERAPDRRRERLTIQANRLDDAGLPVGRGQSRRDRGRQRFDGLEPGRYRVRVGRSAEGGFRADAVQEIEVVPGRRARVDLRIE
ncbi:MAG: carboxypeptidase-like regulatory domain-containing protein [Planctomycetota bacterium]|nr:carboxypeptidase-like regulatory domain-containing protein [Planctomycetota bacterium]